MSVSPRNAIFGSIAVSIAFVMELTLIPLLLPAIQSEFGLSIGQLAWVFNSYGVAVALGVLLGGWLGDVFSAKRIFSIGVVLFAIGSVAVGVAGTYDAIILGRIVQGFGGGVFSPLIPLLLTRWSPDQPGKILIIWGSLAGYVGACAPFIFGSTIAAFGWKFAFVIFAIVSTTGLAIVLQSRKGAVPAPVAQSNVQYSNLFRSRQLWVMFVYVFCTYGAITYFLFRLPLWLADQDYRISSIGFTLSIVWLSFSFVSTLLRNMVDEPRVRGILMAGPVLIASGFPLAFLCEQPVCIGLASMLVGCGLACSNAPSTQLILKFAPRGMGAISASMDITFARLGGVVTVALFAQAMFGLAVTIVMMMSAVAFMCALASAKWFDETA